jgi:hypothetical protein
MIGEIITRYLQESQALEERIKGESFQQIEREVFLYVKRIGVALLTSILNKLSQIDHEERS